MERGGNLRDRRLASAIGILLCSSIVFSRPTDAWAEGLVWKVQTTNNTVFLAGSFHALSARDYPMGASYEQAYVRCSRIVFEADLSQVGTPAFNNYVLSKARYPAGKTIRQAMAPADYLILQNVASTNGQPKTFFDPYRPWFADSVVANWLTASLGLQPSLGLDQYFFNRSRADQRKVEFLESPQNQIDVLSSISEAEMVRQLNRDLAAGTAGIEQLHQAWKAADLALLETLSSPSPGESLEGYEAILYRRNRNWLPKIETYIASKTPTLIIVGAAHLVGTNSVVELLRQRHHNVQSLIADPPVWTSFRVTENVAECARSFENPDQVDVFEQDRVELLANHEGDPATRYEWSRDGTVLPGQSARSLIIAPTQTSDSGLYQVHIFNAAGESMSKPLRVHVAPPQLVLTKSKQPGALALKIKGTPCQRYQVWYTESLDLPLWKPYGNPFPVDALEPERTISIESQGRFYRIGPPNVIIGL